MTMLRQIQDAAVDSTVNLADLLRRCKLLGARLGSEEFKRWVDHELNGYVDRQVVPEYRVLRVNSFGHFVGAFGMQLPAAPIPPMTIPEKYRDMMRVHKLAEPISSLIELLRGDGEDNFRVPWSPDLVVVVGSGVYQDMTCLSAWMVIPRGSLAAIVDTVRTRILNFAIEIEATAPDAGEAASNTQPIPKAHVSDVFNTIVLGSVGNLATGGHGFSQASAFEVRQGDVDSLKEALAALDIPMADISALERAIADDKTPATAGGKLGPRVARWLGHMVEKAAQGTLKIGVSVAGSVLTKAISKYLGLE
jgi:AbiTii